MNYAEDDLNGCRQIFQFYNYRGMGILFQTEIKNEA